MCDVNVHNGVKLMKQCYMLQIGDLKEQIADYLSQNLTDDNASEFLNASLRYKEQNLYEKAFKYILENAETALLTEGFSDNIVENEFIKLLGKEIFHQVIFHRK